MRNRWENETEGNRRAVKGVGCGKTLMRGEKQGRGWRVQATGCEHEYDMLKNKNRCTSSLMQTVEGKVAFPP